MKEEVFGVIAGACIAVYIMGSVFAFMAGLMDGSMDGPGSSWNKHRCQVKQNYKNVFFVYHVGCWLIEEQKQDNGSIP